MSDNSTIEWTDATWNPIRARNLTTGKIGWHCEHATTACEFCYAEGFNKRLGTGLPFKPGHRKDIEIFLDQEMLLAPLRWKKPRMIFVCSMTDLFAEFVADEMLDRIFAMMALATQHTFQLLTKRATRMREYFDSRPQRGMLDERIADHGSTLCWATSDIRALSWDYPAWPLPNVWLGVSCERQQEADERIPLLLQTPAAVRFISAEPLLGPIDISNYLVETASTNWDWYLDWVIAGGESGPHARPMHPDWARSLRDQCQAGGAAFFFKQWGEWLTDDGYPGEKHRVGKKLAGRLLDGKLHNDLPHSHSAPALLSSSQTTPSALREMKATKGGERARG